MFQQKCFNRIYDMQSHGMTMIIVSHNPYQLDRLCSRIAVMDRGRLSPLALPKEALSLYQDLVHRDLVPGTGTYESSRREGTHAVIFERVVVEGARDLDDGAFRTNGPLQIAADILAEKPGRRRSL